MFEKSIKIGRRNLRVATHDRPHLDEVGAISLLYSCASEEWVKVNYPKGTMEIGIGGGKFDDHAKNISEGKKRSISACQLVANNLGIDGHSDIQHIQKYINDCDNRSPGDSFNLADVFWKMQKVNPENENENFDWAFYALDIKIDNPNKNFNIDHIYHFAKRSGYDKIDLDAWLQRGKKALEADQRSFKEALKEFYSLKSKGMVTEVKIIIGSEECKIVGLKSDKMKMGAALRSGQGAGAGVTLIKNSKGNYHIELGKRFRANFDEVMFIIRCWEQRKNRNTQAPRTEDWKELRESGSVSGSMRWFYFKQGNKIFNGSLTHPDVEPTRLTFKEVFYSAYLGLIRYNKKRQKIKTAMAASIIQSKNGQAPFHIIN